MIQGGITFGKAKPPQTLEIGVIKSIEDAAKDSV
jgi:hypothetical protein